METNPKPEALPVDDWCNEMQFMNRYLHLTVTKPQVVALSGNASISWAEIATWGKLSDPIMAIALISNSPEKVRDDVELTDLNEYSDLQEVIRYLERRYIHHYGYSGERRARGNQGEDR